MNYKNPILLCDYSDPDVIRVGGTFYMTASSFNFMPGLPILTSTNLVDWTLRNYAVRSLPFARYDEVQNACGVWAPSIRFHGGKFHIFFGTPDEGLFHVSAEDPLGKWGEVECVWSGKGFEDPCPIWISEGAGKSAKSTERLFLVHGYVKSRIGFNSKLGLLELDPETFGATSGDRIIFDGTETQPTIEGPKIYERDGFFYIFAPAGGVTEGWQTVLRSRKIEGPWEEKIVLSQGNSGVNGPHQGAWVRTERPNESGISDWFVHFQERGIFGRIAHLEPVKWRNGWPLVGSSVLDGKETGEPVGEFEMPFAESAGSAGADSPANGGWQFSANARDGLADFPEGKIVLHAQDFGERRTLWNTPNLLTRKVDSEFFEARFCADVGLLEGELSVVFLGNEYKALAVSRKSGKSKFAVIESSSGRGDEERAERRREYPIEGEVRSVEFSLGFKKTGERTAEVSISFALPSGFRAEILPFSVEKAHWVGGRYGFCATGSGSAEIRLA